METPRGANNIEARRKERTRDQFRVERTLWKTGKLEVRERRRRHSGQLRERQKETQGCGCVATVRAACSLVEIATRAAQLGQRGDGAGMLAQRRPESHQQMEILKYSIVV